MKLLHTSDIQLDAPFTFLGAQGQTHRAQLRETFAEIIRLAKDGSYQALLIAGDLFDSNRPSQTTVDFVVTQLQKLSIPVCILPGNHDCYEAGSIYRKMSFPGNVTVFTDVLGVKVFPDLDLAVYGKAVLRGDSKDSPLGELHPLEATRWHVAMAHGNLPVGGLENPPRLIRLEEIAACGMDYVALGDWHTYANYSQGEVTAIYSGSPEPTSFDHKGAGFVASVSLDDGGVQAERIRIGKISTDQIELDVSGMNEAEIVEFLSERMGDSHLMLEVILTGVLDIGTVIAPDRLEQTLSPKFYYVRCRDRSHPHLENISTADYPPEHVIGQFVKLMKERIDTATDEDARRRAEQALQVGVALLEGREVL